MLCAGCPFTFATIADLKEGVTDEGLRALVSAGCGRNLMSLTLSCGFLCVWMLFRV